MKFKMLVKNIKQIISKQSLLTQNPFILFIFLLLIGWLIYLPDPNSLGYFNDDWYLMYDAKVMGVEFFNTIFEIDRPLRAPLQITLYTLFGENALGYQINALIVRALGAVILGLSIRKITGESSAFWPVYSFLFFAYPGFLSLPNAIDYQAHLYSILFSAISIYSFLQAIQSDSKAIKISLLFLSTLSSWLYLGLMEYFIGIEVFKLLLGGVLIADDKSIGKTIKNVINQGSTFFLGLLGAVGFFVWRTFFFESQRKATDISGAFTVYLGNPITVSIKWVIELLSNFWNALVGAWVVPLYSALNTSDPKNLIVDLVLWLFVCGLLLLIVYSGPDDRKINLRFLLIAGILGSLAGIFPFIFAGREINFEDYSRYTLPVMGAVVLLLTALLLSINDRKVRFLIIALLSFSITLTHRANFRVFAERTSSERNFWWQVYWRAPDLREGITLIIDYPNSAIQEDYFIWAPANFIYSEQALIGDTLNVPINALVLNTENLNSILAGRGQVEHYRRGNFTSADFGDVLVFSQATVNSCVRVMNKNMLEFSEFESAQMRMAGSVSDTNLIKLDNGSGSVPANIFGEEPTYAWCYYFQKADLARQQEDWNLVIELGKQAIREGTYPSDRSEWMPFLQANIMLGNVDQIKDIGKRFTENKYLKQMACDNFLHLAPDDTIRNEIKAVFCSG